MKTRKGPRATQGHRRHAAAVAAAAASGLMRLSEQLSSLLARLQGEGPATAAVQLLPDLDRELEALLVQLRGSPYLAGDALELAALRG